MLSKEDYLTLDAVALGEGIARGDFSALEVNQCAVERAQEINPALNAIVHEGYEAALARVTAASPNNSSPLAGVPFLIKDLSPAAGLPACFGSALFKHAWTQTHDFAIRGARLCNLLLAEAAFWADQPLNIGKCLRRR